MRQSTFQRVDIPLSRDLESEYDDIVVIKNNIEGIIAVADAIEQGVDFENIANLATDVANLELAMTTKVDKETGKSLMTDSERTKLQFIAQQATKNQSDAYLLDRVNHTGTQSADTLIDGSTNVAMTVAERVKLGVIEDGANNYVHPSKHPVTILDGGTNYSKVLKTDMAGVVGFGDVSWSEVSGKPSTFTPIAHEHSMDEITSGSIAAARVIVSEGRQFITAEQAAALLDMEAKSNKGVPLGYVPLDINGKINPSFINDLNLIEVFTPNDLASMLNLTSAQPGDIAYRLDTSNTYMLIALPSNVESNWKQLNAGFSVISINGLSGVVNLNTSDIPENTNLYFTNKRVDDRVAALLQAGTNVSLSYDDISGTLTISVNDTIVDWSEVQSKPTTLNGYGITDAYTKTEVQTVLPKIGLDITNVTPPSTGQMAWNQDEKTIDVGINGVTLQMGQELMTMVRNGSASTITQGTVCMGIGTVGASGRIVVGRADMSNPANSRRVLGIATEDILNGADGFVTSFGKVRTLDTSMWAEGDSLYISNTIPGGLTNVVPTTGVKQGIARVINSHATNGTLMVRVVPVDELAYYPNDAKLTSLVRADRWLASQNIAAMVYTGSDLTKIQYNNATNVDYEVLGYTSGDLTSIQHYIGSVLKGTTTLIYSSGTLVSAVFVGV